MSSSILAQEELMDHYKFPRNKKTIQEPTFSENIYNPSCGDRIALTGVVTDGVLTDLGFAGSGCVLSQAAASILTEQVIGKTVVHIKQLDADTMINLVGIELGPTRARCATLALEVLKKSL